MTSGVARREPQIRSLTRVPWLRVVGEGALIVLSILLAFGIDAWWERLGDQERVRANLSALHEEFESLAQDLDRQSTGLAGAIAATTTFLEHTGSGSAELSSDSVGQLVVRSFLVGPIYLQAGTLEALLASGDLAEIDNDELVSTLGSWPRRMSSVWDDSSEFVWSRERDILPHLRTLVPEASIARRQSIVDLPESGFPVHLRVLLQDRTMESLFANRALRGAVVLRQLEGARAEAAEIIRLIETELSQR